MVSLNIRKVNKIKTYIWEKEKIKDSFFNLDTTLAGENVPWGHRYGPYGPHTAPYGPHTAPYGPVRPLAALDGIFFKA